MYLLTGFVVLLGFTYPFWGVALLLWLCKVCAVTGPLSGRLLVAAIVASVTTLILTPIMLGNETFAVPVPWYVGFIDWKRAHYHIASSASVFAMAFVANLVFGWIAPAMPTKVRPARRRL